MSRLSKAIYVAVWALICVGGWALVSGVALASDGWRTVALFIAIGIFAAPIITFASARNYR